MKKVLVWGATPSIYSMLLEIEREYQVVGFVDNNSHKWGTTLFEKPIYSPELICTITFEYIIIASLSSMGAIKKQIINSGIDEHKIITKYVECRISARINFLKNLSEQIQEELMPGSVAEVGVFQGDFARYINEYFPHKKLYLFDTFSGFDQRDIDLEVSESFSNATVGHLSNTSIDIVMQKMKHPENIMIKEGYFPESVAGVDDIFCFVNLDLDLYKPTLQGLHFFWSKLCQGGVILIHDYYSDGYLGVKQAVKEFELCIPSEAILLPIGDSCSIALVKVIKG